MIRLSALFAVSLMCLHGCEGCDGDPTGVGDGSNAHLSGTWEFSASGGGANLFTSGRGSVTSTLHLTQTGGTVSGSHTNTVSRTSFCSDLVGCFYSSEGIPQGVVQGSVNGKRVVLQFNTDSDPDLERYEGTANGNRIEGDGWSAEKGETEPPPPIPPAAPTNLTATVDAQALEVQLRWTDNSNDEDGFAVAERCVGVGEWSVLGIVDSGSTAVRITGYVSGQSCSYLVFAFRMEGDQAVLSNPSNEVSVTIP